MVGSQVVCFTLRAAGEAIYLLPCSKLGRSVVADSGAEWPGRHLASETFAHRKFKIRISIGGENLRVAGWPGPTFCCPQSRKFLECTTWPHIGSPTGGIFHTSFPGSPRHLVHRRPSLLCNPLWRPFFERIRMEVAGHWVAIQWDSLGPSIGPKFAICKKIHLTLFQNQSENWPSIYCEAPIEWRPGFMPRWTVMFLLLDPPQSDRVWALFDHVRMSNERVLANTCSRHYKRLLDFLHMGVT